MAAPNSSSDSMRELEALIAALPRHPRADPSAPNCKIKRTCTPFWYGAEEPDHIRHIFSVYADHLCPEQTAASTQRRRCPMFFIGRISRLAPCTLETDTLAHEPAAKDSERAPPNSGSFLKSSEPHSPSWAGAPRADPFRTLDVVEWFVRDAAPLGEPLNAHHVEYWEVSWNREEGLPESFEKLSKIDFNCRARVSSGPAPCCAPAKCVDCAVASADSAPRAPDCAVSSGLCLCSCACPHRRLRILHCLPVLGTRDEFRYTSDTAPRPVGYLKVAPSRSPSTAYRSPSARSPQSPARMPVVLHSSLVSPSSMAVPTIVQGIQATRRVMLQSYTITISSLCPSPAGPSGAQAPTLGTLGRSCSALSVDLNLNLELEEAEGEGFGGALTVRPVPLPVRCSSAPPATAARSPLGADYGFEWTREEEEAGGIPREEDTEREMDPDVDPQEQEEEEEAAQDQDELGWEFGAEPDDCSAFDNLPFEEDEEEHSEEEEEEEEEEDEEGDQAHQHVLGHRSPHAHLDPLSRARTREADELAALAAALTRPLCTGSWALWAYSQAIVNRSDV